MQSLRDSTILRVHDERRFSVLKLWGIFLSLDAAEIVGTHEFSENFSRLACAVRPLGAIAIPLIPDRLLDFVAVQCGGQPQEPVSSIIFLSFKFSLSIIGILFLCIRAMFGRNAYSKLRKIYLARMMKTHDYLRQLRNYLLISSFCVVVSVSLWLELFFLQSHDIRKAPQNFDISLVHKIIMEDLLACMIFICGVLAVGFVFLFVVIPVQQKISDLSKSDGPKRG